MNTPDIENPISKCPREYVAEGIYLESKPDGNIRFLSLSILKLPCYSYTPEKDIDFEKLIAKGLMKALIYSAGEKEYVAYFDTVSGRVHFDIPTFKKQNANLILPQLKNMDEATEKNIMKDLCNHYEIKAKLEKIKEKNIDYYVNFDLQELKEASK
jgi:hypothetical protein